MSKMTNKLLSIGVVATSLVLTASVAQAQNYNVSTDNQAFTSIANDPNAVPQTLGDDENTTNTIDFDFEFFGVTKMGGVDTFRVNTNGFIAFDGGTGSNFSNTTIPATAQPNDAVFAFWDDLVADVNFSNLVVLTTGTAPNRVTTIEYNNVRRIGGSAPELTMQIQLFEGTNVIRINYDPASPGFGATRSGTIGIEDAAGATGFGGPNTGSTNPAIPTENYIFTPFNPQGAEIQPLGGPTPSTTNPVQGVSFTVDCVVSNPGQAATGAFDIEVFAGTTSIGTGSVTDLAGGATQTVTISVTIPAAVPNGNIDLTFVADSGMAVTEVDETNNTSTAVSVFVGQKPDLTGTIETTNGAITVIQGDSFSVDITIQNLTSTAVASFNVDVYSSTNNIISTGDTFLQTVNFPNGVGANATVTVTVLVSTPLSITIGTGRFAGMIIDPTDAIDEDNENNNNIPGSNGDIEYVGPPQIDLQPTAVTPQNLTVVAGTTLLVDRTVTNNGADPANQFVSQVLLSTDAVADAGDTVLTTETISMIAAGGADTGTTTVTIPGGTAPGNFFIIYVADTGMAISETDETNNELASAQITVTAAGVGADLSVPTASLSAQMAAANSQIMVTRTIANNGNQASGSFQSGVYFSTDNVITTADTLLSNFTITDIAAGASDGPQSITVTIPNVAPGTYFIGVIADDNNMLAETDEGNNVSTALSIVVNNRVGDIDGDTIVNIMDIQICINQSIGLIPTTGPADVNNDGNVNVLDVQTVINTSLQPTP